MTRVLTVRIPPELLSKAEARAAQLGLDRASYVRGLIEEDLTRKGTEPKHTFASEDLLGSISLGGGPYTNQRVREILRENLRAKRERNR